MKTTKRALIFYLLIWSFVINAETKPGLNNTTPFFIHLFGKKSAALVQAHDGAPVNFGVFNDKGQAVFSAAFSQCINPATSFNKNYLAFSDGRNLYVYNSAQNNLKRFDVNSSIFSVDNNGALGVFDERKHAFVINDHTLILSDHDFPIGIVHTNTGFVSLSRISIYINEHEVRTNSDGEYIKLHLEGENVIVTSRFRYPEKIVYKNYILNTANQQLSLLNVREKQTGSPKSKSESLLKRGFEQINGPLHNHHSSYAYRIGNSYGEMQEYTAGQTYLHPGVDVLGVPGDTVYAVRAGIVKAILTTSGPNYWRIAIANEFTDSLSYGYLYAHVNDSTFFVAVGDTVVAGDPLGQIVQWSVPGFDHCHFAHIMCKGTVWAGNWWTIGHPLKAMQNHTDHSKPHFKNAINNDRFAFRSTDDYYLNADSLTGDIQILASVYDSINTSWQADVYQMGYNVSPLDSPARKVVDITSFTYDFPIDYYFQPDYTQQVLNTIYSRDQSCFSVGNYNQRDFFQVVSNSDGNDTIDLNDQLERFKTTSLPNGSYVIRVWAIDASGNYGVDSMVVKIKNMNTSNATNIGMNQLVNVFPNPSNGDIAINSLIEISSIEVCDAVGRKLELEVQSSNTHRSEFKLASGFYVLKVNTVKGVFAKKIVVR